MGACTAGRCCVRGMACSVSPRSARLTEMMGRLTFGVLCLAAATATLGQDLHTASTEKPELRPIARTEGRKILAAIPAVDAEADSETDCSHLVHDIYSQAGFGYDYVTSRELYTGNANFVRVRAPQAGDLVVWRGHVGIVINPKEHSFFSFVRSGAETQFYDSPYWRARGSARFLRYVREKPSHAERTLRAAGRSDDEGASRSVSTIGAAGPLTVETSRETALQVAGKNPSPDEVMAAFVEMNRNSGEFLRARGVNSPGRSVVVYRELRVSTVQIKGKRGTAVVRIDSMADSWDPQGVSQPGWREQSLELEKTKRGWVMHPVEGVAYVKREVALRVLSARLADVSQKPVANPEQEREQRQIIRFLNSLVTENSDTASAENN